MDILGNYKTENLNSLNFGKTDVAINIDKKKFLGWPR